jgi:hypothetical protein
MRSRIAEEFALAIAPTQECVGVQGAVVWPWHTHASLRYQSRLAVAQKPGGFLIFMSAHASSSVLNRSNYFDLQSG